MRQIFFGYIGARIADAASDIQVVVTLFRFEPNGTAIVHGLKGVTDNVGKDALNFERIHINQMAMIKLIRQRHIGVLMGMGNFIKG
jgi:hypothetical protein